MTRPPNFSLPSEVATILSVEPWFADVSRVANDLQITDKAVCAAIGTLRERGFKFVFDGPKVAVARESWEKFSKEATFYSDSVYA